MSINEINNYTVLLVFTSLTLSESLLYYVFALCIYKYHFEKKKNRNKNKKTFTKNSIMKNKQWSFLIKKKYTAIIFSIKRLFAYHKLMDKKSYTAYDLLWMTKVICTQFLFKSNEMVPYKDYRSVVHAHLFSTYQAISSPFKFILLFCYCKNEHVRGKTVNVFKVHFYNFILSVIYTASWLLFCFENYLSSLS